jgi:hypothetical protein
MHWQSLLSREKLDGNNLRTFHGAQKKYDKEKRYLNNKHEKFFSNEMIC